MTWTINRIPIIMSMRKYLSRCCTGMILSIAVYSCAPELNIREVDKSTPEGYTTSLDSTNSVKTNWRTYFQDPILIALIDTALYNNQELNIVLQEIEMERNEMDARKGEYLPFVHLGTGIGYDKVGRFTRPGAVEANNDIRPGVEFPELLGDYMLGAFADWEVDIWKKLRNSKKSQYFRYLSSIEGRNFMVTNLIAEIANTYYELLALDNELEIAKQNIEIQNNAYNIVKVQKQTARVTELAVRRFEAQVLDTRALQYKIQQEIIETENRLNFLLGRFPRPIPRDPLIFSGLSPDTVLAGVPAQLLQNRPDIRQAEMELEAAKLNVKAARAQFYPSLGITGGLGYQAYNPRFLISTPESILLGLAGEATMPLINRRAILATYKNAGATQMQAVINYEQVLLNAYIEVANQIANIDNLQESYKLKEQQVEALNASVNISNSLFMSARADYMEVLLTQQEALESRFELVETKMLQLHAWINVYRALGGGWN